MFDDVTGRFELHVFVQPLDPPPEVVAAFRRACESADPAMKALLLQLDYVGRGFVGVLQSSRYVEGNIATATAAVRADAEVLRAAGLTVMREKVEAVATNDGVPHRREQALPTSATRYFELHVLIGGTGSASSSDSSPGSRPLDDDDMTALRAVSRAFAAKLARPVPLSFNALKPSQRFLNLRASGVGVEEALGLVDDLRVAVEASGLLQVTKVIAEYICFDSHRAVDNGWLEPLP